MSVTKKIIDSESLASDFETDVQETSTNANISVVVQWSGLAGADDDTKMSLQINNVADPVDGGWQDYSPDSNFALSNGAGTDGFEGLMPFPFWRIKYVKSAANAGVADANLSKKETIYQ